MDNIFLKKLWETFLEIDQILRLLQICHIDIKKRIKSIILLKVGVEAIKTLGLVTTLIVFGKPLQDFLKS